MPRGRRRTRTATRSTAALSFDVERTTTTLEVKSNRNFYTVAASVGQQAPEFAIVAYSFLPPAESFNMLDAEGTGDFNACVEGGRLREDVNVNHDLLVYGQGVYAYSLTEQPSGQCDAMGRTLTPQGILASSVQDVVWDGVTGFEYTFDDKLSHAFASAGARDDTLRDGAFQYREQHVGVLGRQVPRRSLVARGPGATPPPEGAGLQHRPDDVRARVVVRGRELRRAADGAQVGLLAGLRVHDAHRAAADVLQRLGALQVHERLERARLRGRAARRLPVRERDMPLLPRVRGGEARS